MHKRLIGGTRSDDREHTGHLTSAKIERANGLLGENILERPWESQLLGCTVAISGAGIPNSLALDGGRAWGQMALAFGAELLPRRQNGIPRGYYFIGGGCVFPCLKGTHCHGMLYIWKKASFSS